MSGGRQPDLVAARSGLRNDNRPVVDPRMAGGTLVELQAPAELSPYGREVFDMMTPALLSARVLREDDVPILIECVEAWAMARWYRKRTWALMEELEKSDLQRSLLSGDELRDHLVEVEMLDGSLKRARAGWNQSATLAARLSSDMGLGPVARVKLGLAKVQGQSLIEALMGDNAGES